MLPPPLGFYFCFVIAQAIVPGNHPPGRFNIGENLGYPLIAHAGGIWVEKGNSDHGAGGVVDSHTIPPASGIGLAPLCHCADCPLLRFYGLTRGPGPVLD